MLMVRAKKTTLFSQCNRTVTDAILILHMQLLSRPLEVSQSLNGVIDRICLHKNTKNLFPDAVDICSPGDKDKSER